jgi:hypothetical protein
MDAIAHALENAGDAVAHARGAFGALKVAADAAGAECEAQHAATHAAAQTAAIEKEKFEAQHAAAHAAAQTAAIEKEKLEAQIAAAHAATHAAAQTAAIEKEKLEAQHAAAHAAAQTAAIEKEKNERAIKKHKKATAELQEGCTTMQKFARLLEMGDVSGHDCTDGAEGSDKEVVFRRRRHLPRVAAARVVNKYVYEDEDESEQEDEDKTSTIFSEEHKSEQEDEDESNGSKKCAVPECEVLRMKGSEFCRENHRCLSGWLKKKGKDSQSGHCKAQRERNSEYCGRHKCGSCHLSKFRSDFCKKHKDG